MAEIKSACNFGLYQHYVVGIDPAFGGTGIAIFQDGKLTNVTRLRKTGNQSFEERAHDLALRTANWIYDTVSNRENPRVGIVSPPVVICEIPAYQGTPSRSMGWKKGDLQKLTYLVGSMGQTCMDLAFETEWNTEFMTVTPAGWKGQLSKKIVIDRIRKRIPDVDKDFQPKLDIWDAIGIGLWALGKF